MRNALLMIIMAISVMVIGNHVWQGVSGYALAWNVFLPAVIIIMGALALVFNRRWADVGRGFAYVSIGFAVMVIPITCASLMWTSPVSTRDTSIKPTGTPQMFDDQRLQDYYAYRLRLLQDMTDPDLERYIFRSQVAAQWRRELIYDHGYSKAQVAEVFQKAMETYLEEERRK